MADRYWVGGSGSWTATTNWSTASGGGGGASVPTATDNVYFDSNSGSTNYTVTTSSNLNCLNLNIAQPSSGTLTFAGNGIMNVSGSLNCSGGNIVWGVVANFNFIGAGSQSVRTSGVTFDRFVFNGGGTTFTLLDSINLRVNFQPSNGTINFNNQTINSPIISMSGGGTRTLDFTSGGVLNLYGSAGTIINGILTTGLTILGNSTVNLTYSGSTGTRTVNIGAGAVGYLNINVTAGSDTVAISTVVGDLNLTGFTGTLTNIARTVYGNLVLGSGMTTASGAAITTMAATTTGKIVQSNGTLVNFLTVFNGVGGSWSLQDNVATANTTVTTTLTAGTLNLNNNILTTGTFSANGTGIRTLAFGATGNVNIIGTGWSAGTVTNFSYTGNGAINYNYTGAATNRSIGHGGSGGASFTTKAPPIYINSGAGNLLITTNSWLSDLTFNSNAANFTTTNFNIGGNLILTPGLNIPNSGSAIAFSGPANVQQTLDTANVTVHVPIQINGNSTVNLANTTTLANTKSLTVISGTLATNGHDLSMGAFVSSGSGNITINISNSNVYITGAAINGWSMATSTNATLTANNSNIIFNNDSTTTRGIAAGEGLTYGNLVMAGNGVAQFQFFGNSTYNSIISTKTVSQNVVFTANSTTTVNDWSVPGTANANVLLTSSGSTPFNLIKAGGGTINVNYYTISYSSASPSNTWYSLLTNNNVDGGNNTGWIFTAPPPSGNSGSFFALLNKR